MYGLLRETKFPNQLQRLIEQSGHCSIWRVSLLSWAAGSLFTSVWTEPKKIVDTCSVVLVGCLVFWWGFGWKGNMRFSSS